MLENNRDCQVVCSIAVFCKWVLVEIRSLMVRLDTTRSSKFLPELRDHSFPSLYWVSRYFDFYIPLSTKQ